METKSISIDDYDYDLPEARIALHPLAERDGCKLLVRNSDGSIRDATFRGIGSYLPEGALLVVNNTRVINARLRFRKGNDGARIEIFCLEPAFPADYERNFASTGSCRWKCLVGNSKKWKEGEVTLAVDVAGKGPVTLLAERVARNDAESEIEFRWDRPDITFSEIISAAGEIPIPPYLNRNSELSDATDYQTVYSRIEGSVAAPTAGLHFTDRLFRQLEEQGFQKRELTLHVGAGTFRPVKSQTIGDHKMHSEFIVVSRELVEELANTHRPVIAVGTTSVRTLETLYHLGLMAARGMEPHRLDQWSVYDHHDKEFSKKHALGALLSYMDSRGDDTLTASTEIIIAPGYRYRMVDGIVTNFHQPKSTLLLLVSAFIGPEWHALYRHALDADYRFLSYGDGMLLLK